MSPRLVCAGVLELGYDREVRRRLWWSEIIVTFSCFSLNASFLTILSACRKQNLK